MLEIPLNSSPEQIFDISISGSIYSLRVIYNTRSKVWTADIYRGSTTFISGLTLVGGVDLSAHLNIPIKNLYLVNLEDSSKDPTDSNLGLAARLFIVPEVEDEPSI